MAAFDIDLFDNPDERGVVADLNGALLFLHDREPARFLFFGDVIAHGERGGVGARRIFEAKMESYWTSSRRSSVSAKSFSVSPGKPTMMSEVMAIGRRAFFIQAMRSMY